MVTVRPAGVADREFLERMLAVAADWQEPTPRAVSDLLAVPELAHYIVGWPAPGDFGVVAESEAPIGAAWWRQFTADDPGYGFIDALTPEISIGVVAPARGAGTGTLLLWTLIGAARERGLRALSLSVASENEARRLYERFGFEEVGAAGGSVTMVLAL